MANPSLSPIGQCWELITGELGAWFTWSTNASLFGIPFIAYFAGIAIVGIIIEYIFG